MEGEGLNPDRIWYIKYKHGLVPCLEKLRGHVLDNIERYLTLRDFVNENKTFALRIVGKTQRQAWDIDVAAFLYLRGMPKELVCYRVAWEDRIAYGLFVALGAYGVAAIRKSFGSFLPEEPRPKDIYRWVGGEEEPPEEVVKWVEGFIARHPHLFLQETKPPG